MTILQDSGLNPKSPSVIKVSGTPLLILQAHSLGANFDKAYNP
jgi:hypothetical protein